jgi:thiosulfate/3-mercaptopyruvate sulfurtransferase
VHDSARVVLYGEAMPVARAALALAAIGHERVSLLDGGLARWKAEGHPTATNEERPYRRPLTVRPARPGLVVDAEWVRTRAGDGTATVLDVRTADEFAGAGPRRGDSEGHVPGARHLDWTELLAAGGRDDLVFRPRAELDSLFRARGVAPAGSGATVAAYCTVGQRAAVGWLAARLLGHDARVYDGSYVDWVARGLPLERAPVDSARADSVRADSVRADSLRAGSVRAGRGARRPR